MSHFQTYCKTAVIKTIQYLNKDRNIDQWIWFSSYLNGLVVFPPFFTLRSEFCNKEFMIWARVSSWSCFCFWTVVLEKTLECPLGCKEIQPVHPKGNWSWIFIGRIAAEAEMPILWPPDAKTDALEKTLLLGKIEGRKDVTTEDEMVGWHRQLNGHEFE